MNIGENLKRIRKIKGLTQDNLSELTKISITSIQRYESGKRQPTIESIDKFAEALGVSVFELLDNKYDKAEYELEEVLNNHDNLLLEKLKRYYEQKKWEYENIDIEHNIKNEGILKGLEIAISIMNER